MNDLIIAGHHFQSRLLLGTGKFSSKKIMAKAIEASGTQMVTVALKRIDVSKNEEDIGHYLKSMPVQLLPNTSGAKNAKEAILAAQLGREAGGREDPRQDVYQRTVAGLITAGD